MTKLAEKERKIRKNLRIKETLERNGEVWFSPQIKILGIWSNFDEYTTPGISLLLPICSKRYPTLELAKKVIDKYVNYRLAKTKVVYHNVNYLTP